MICDITGLQLSKVAGRFAVKVPNHPKANNTGYVLRYRYIMEQKLGRYLRCDEEVHHKDEDPTNDRVDNLVLMTKMKHSSQHGISRIKLDYSMISELRKSGLGYKRIAKHLNYPLSSVKSACKRIAERGDDFWVRQGDNGD